jgi:uncharacterized BrkB/YihY/UPF0761 family membrane protein
VLTLGVKAAWLTIKRSLITIYKDVYDEHLFVFAAVLSYYFVLSLQSSTPARTQINNLNAAA